MKIVIEYDSCWRNSFLDGSNNEPINKGGRNFVGSMTNLKKAGNFIHREVTIDTVMGVLNRLIGDQRKLYQSRLSPNYYFKTLEHQVSFVDRPLQQPSSEIVYLRNMNGNTDQNSFSGVLVVNEPMFTSGFSAELWSVLWMDWEQLCTHIVEEKEGIVTPELDPLIICEQFENAGKLKPVSVSGLAEKALNELKLHFPEVEYLNKGFILPGAFYCSALYLQLKRLEKRFDMSTIKTKAGGISGVSKRTFTKKDFMKRFTTGNGKLIFGNPYLLKERVKNEGEITSVLTKASGSLDIKIDIDVAKGNELKTMIENAGVSSFFLGKKGLAYVSQIDPRPSRRDHESLF